MTKRFVLPDLGMLLTPKIKIMTVGIFWTEWGLFIPIAYISSYALSEGIERKPAYNMLTFLNVGSLLGRWLPGYVGDKIGRFNTQILAVLLCIVSVLLMWMLASRDVSVLIATSVIFRFASGGNTSLTPVCLRQLCEVERFGRFYATVYTMSSFGALTGVPVGGALLSSACGRYWA
ncbi:uncharacterized protein A1O5_04990 [Cladophialophora psammophila CBS 110553]|uniref:Major facilitator superfamily (MFS) profile domain-containing protein n=1 Tax=Cladophialophora psammophila CBS 110553 TaxID=1182543 RepID=W9X593_9EURO|nr:uncharacterized protein A1O5_04990 [Cladophialophora psammophila CBS 110553]EXJ72485.1 hypothetical protein A1O5_04990 [Cladophialophora psammophila CBS 110553]